MNNSIHEIPIPGGLLDRVLNRVHYEIDIMGVKRRIVLFSGLSLILSLVLFVSAKSLWSQLNVSGFFYFTGLIFSDFQIIVDYWQSFFLAIIQSLPVFNLLWTVLLFSALFKSLESLIRNTGESFGFYAQQKIN